MSTVFKIFLINLFLICANSEVFCKDYIIYSVTHSVPMGEPNEQNVKNYFVNLGKQQGLKEGTVLNVYRSITMSDPYETKNKYNYNVKIGEIKILHTEDGSAIALSEKFTNEKVALDVQNFMIGDKVEVKLNN